MSTDETVAPEVDSSVASAPIEQLRSLGSSPAGESVLVARPVDDEELDDDPSVELESFVLKKITGGPLRAPERFQQKFAALCRLDHRGLADYRDLYLGEAATRVTRDFVDAVPLDTWLLRPISKDEERELSGAAPTASDDDGEPHVEDSDEISSQEESAAEEAIAPPVEEPSPESTTDEEAGGGSDRPTTLEIPEELLEDSEAGDRALDLIILRLRRIIPSLVEALEYLHRFRQVHGHLTPTNILIAGDETVRLTDFGLYPELDLPIESRQRFPQYDAPEVLDGDYSAQSDLYSLGAILYEVLADRSFQPQRRHETPGSNGPNTGPVYLSEVIPHCPASWVDLIHALLVDEPHRRPTIDEVYRQLADMEARSVNIPASVVEDQDTLHGRGESLETLVERAKHCAQERTFEIGFVEGHPGVGKSALLDTLARRTAQRGWLVLHGRCFHREPITYQGWDEVTDHLARIVADLPENMRERLRDSRSGAARLFPQLSPSDSGPAEISREEAIDRFRDLLRAISEQRPILICIDDLHRAGEDSARLLADLAAQPSGLRVMFVASLQTGEDGIEELALGRELVTAPVSPLRLTIEGFNKREARDYVLTHGEHLTFRQKKRVLRRGGLNPLLIDELIHEFEAQEGLQEPTDAEEEQEVESEQANPTDHHLEEVVQSRLTELPRMERLVLQLLAVAQAPLTAKLLGHAVSRELGTQTTDTSSGLDIVESLVDRRLARRARRIERSTASSTQYVVVHDLCREVILDELGQDHHARLCGLIADALETIDDAREDERFEYLLRAGRDDEAARSATEAARQARERFADHRACRLWRWINKTSKLPEDDRVLFAAALSGAGHHDEAVELLYELLPAKSLEQELALRGQIVDSQLAAGQRVAAINALHEALNAAGDQPRQGWSRPLVQPFRRLTTGLARLTDPTTEPPQPPPDADTLSRARLQDFAVQAWPWLQGQTLDAHKMMLARYASQTGFGPLLVRDRLNMIAPPGYPLLQRVNAGHHRWLAQARELAESHKDHEGLALVAEMQALLSIHSGALGDARSALIEVDEAPGGHSSLSPQIRARLAHLGIQLDLTGGDLERASSQIQRQLHRFRHQRWLATWIELAAIDRDLLVGELDAAHHRMEGIDTFIGDDKDCALHVQLMHRRTASLIARGQAEVAVGQWDLLLDRIYSHRLQRKWSMRFLIHYNLGRALCALGKRQKALGEMHCSQTLRRTRKVLRRLSDLEAWMGADQRSAYFRLQARYALLREAYPRALRFARRAAEVVDDTPLVVAQALNAEMKGIVQSRMEAAEARALQVQAYKRYEELGLYLPLVVEGWPVPAAHARLQEDQD